MFDVRMGHVAFIDHTRLTDTLVGKKVTKPLIVACGVENRL
jgi:hypothetical protein